MKRILILIAFSVVLIPLASSQSAQTIYFELGGPSLAAFNYDFRFSGEDGLGGRIGIGGYGVDGESAIFLPIGLNYLLGKGTRHYFEIGAGVTPVFNNYEYSDGTFDETFGHLLFGYRLQPLDGGFSFRAFVSPVFGNGFFIPYFAGVSFGYKF